MKKINPKAVMLRNQTTKEFESMPALVGESAYEIAKRLGTFSGTEEEWNNYIKTERDAAIKAVQDKGTQTLDTIPDDYTALKNDVDELKQDLDNYGSSTKNLFKASIGNKVVSGVTFENVNNAIMLSGIANQELTVPLGVITLSSGTYSASMFEAKSNNSMRIQIRKYENGMDKGNFVESQLWQTTFDIIETTDIGIHIYIPNGVNTDDTILKPQIEVGNIPTNYMPNHTMIDYDCKYTINNISGKSGNLISINPRSYVIGEVTIQGGEGVIKLNGTSTIDNALTIEDIELPKGTYSLSGFFSGERPKEATLQVKKLENGVVTDNILTTYKKHYGRFTLDEATIVRIRLYYTRGAIFNNVELRPTLVYGKHPSTYIPSNTACDYELRDICKVKNKERSLFDTSKKVQEDIIECIKSYYDNHSKVVYGKTDYIDAPFVIRSTSESTDIYQITENDIGKYSVNCSTLTTLVLQGISFNDSAFRAKTVTTEKSGKIYNDGDVVFKNNSFYKKTNDGWIEVTDTTETFYYYEPTGQTIDLSKEGYYVRENNMWVHKDKLQLKKTYNYGYKFENEELYYLDPNNHFMRTYSTAKYCYEHGYTFYSEDFSNCQTGDLIFFSSGTNANEWFTYDHIGIFLGVDEDYLWTAEIIPYDGTEGCCNANHNPISICYYDKNATSGESKVKLSQLAMFARLPLSSGNYFVQSVFD